MVEPEAFSSVNLSSFAAEIEAALTLDSTGWCSREKATTLAAIVMALRPKIVVELGVWMGGSAIPMAIALRLIGTGHLVAVDAWSAEASVSGQDLEAHRKWWGETMGPDGHERAFETFLRRLKEHDISPACCSIRRQRSDQADVPASIDILHHDANHGPQVIQDIERWTPALRVGGLLILDDLDWAGGHVAQGRVLARELGFVELYSLGTGCVMQRVRSPGS